MIFPLILAGIIFTHEDTPKVRTVAVRQVLTEKQLWWRGFRRTTFYFGFLISFTFLTSSHTALYGKKRDFGRLRYPKEAY